MCSSKWSFSRMLISAKSEIEVCFYVQLNFDPRHGQSSNILTYIYIQSSTPWWLVLFLEHALRATHVVAAGNKVRSGVKHVSVAQFWRFVKLFLVWLSSVRATLQKQHTLPVRPIIPLVARISDQNASGAPPMTVREKSRLDKFKQLLASSNTDLGKRATQPQLHKPL